MGKFIIHQTAKGYTFELLAANGEVIVVSEVYNTEAACRKGVQAVIRCAPIAPVSDADASGKLPPNPRFEIFSDKNGSFRFRLRAKNGKIIGVSQPYGSLAACQNGVESVSANAQNGEIPGKNG